MKKRKALFISFEGIDGCGKSTQIELLRKSLVKRKHDVIVTREPGGTALSERIRKLVLHTKKGDVSVRAELLLYLAARAHHVETVIKPALMQGKIVISDRFHDSTFAYQGGGRKISPVKIADINEFATQGVIPSITFLLDISAEEAQKRILADNRKFDRMEAEGILFQDKVRRAFLKIARNNGRRIKIVNGKLPVYEQASVIEEIVTAVLADIY